MSQSVEKEKVVERFNKEALIWNKVHSGEITDIIQWEVKKRKDFTRDFISRHFHGKPAAILEIGCGAGRNLEEILSEEPLWKGTGVDNASAMVDHCRKQYAGNPRMAFEILDIDSSILEQKFDVILLLGVVGYLGSNSNAFRNIQRMLKPGGYVIFTFGKGFGVARGMRAATGAMRKILRDVRGKTGPGTGASYFRNYTLSNVKQAFPPEWRMVSHINLVFGSGILKRTSVKISQVLERMFTRHDPFRLALTSMVVAVNEAKPASGK
jgi:SAM-dependent methyltransferase